MAWSQRRTRCVCAEPSQLLSDSFAAIAISVSITGVGEVKSRSGDVMQLNHRDNVEYCHTKNMKAEIYYTFLK